MLLRLVLKRPGKFSIGERIITWWTQSPYSHCELWFDGPSNNALTYTSRKFIGTKFFKTPLNTGLWDVITITSDKEKIKSALRYCLKLGHRNYDWLGIFGFIWGRLKYDLNNRFCSEVCDEILTNSGCLPEESIFNSYKISPGSLASELSKLYGPPKVII